MNGGTHPHEADRNVRPTERQECPPHLASRRPTTRASDERVTGRRTGVTGSRSSTAEVDEGQAGEQDTNDEQGDGVRDEVRTGHQAGGGQHVYRALLLLAVD